MASHSTYSSEVILANIHGLHARPATLLVARAKEFQSEISIHDNDNRADCKSILEILSCGCRPGTRITLSATGPDCKEAVVALTNLIKEF